MTPHSALPDLTRSDLASAARADAAAHQPGGQHAEAVVAVRSAPGRPLCPGAPPLLAEGRGAEDDERGAETLAGHRRTALRYAGGWRVITQNGGCYCGVMVDCLQFFFLSDPPAKTWELYL